MNDKKLLKPYLLVSSCLLGNNVRYDGKNCKIDNIDLLENNFTIIPICPEFDVLGCPRNPIEIKNNEVIDKDNNNYTTLIKKKIASIINLCKENDVKYALLKEKSPTCGSHFIYDGTFSRKLIQGSGLLVSELKKLHIQIFNEDEVLKLLNTKTN